MSLLYERSKEVKRLRLLIEDGTSPIKPFWLRSKYSKLASLPNPEGNGEESKWLIKRRRYLRCWNLKRLLLAWMVPLIHAPPRFSSVTAPVALSNTTPSKETASLVQEPMFGLRNTTSGVFQIGSQLRDGNSFLKAKRISTWSGLGGTGKLVTLTHPKKQVVKMYTAK